MLPLQICHDTSYYLQVNNKQNMPLGLLQVSTTLPLKTTGQVTIFSQKRNYFSQLTQYSHLTGGG